jgi:UDP-N-acetylglucosamine/UDP-N-acetylgalactosamine diphosphorylase
VFDALAPAERSVTLEVARELEFSPVKNANGEDSPDTTRRALCRLHAAWVRAAGLPLPEPDAGGVHPVEIDPLLAESEEEFAARVAAGSFERHERGNGHLYLARG